MYTDAVSEGSAAKSLGWAFAAGYQHALRALVPSLPPGTVSFCVTEQRGNGPKAIDTTHVGLRITGKKSFATLGDIAETLLVLAHDGSNGPRKAFTLFRVRASATERRTLPPTPFAPDIRHSEVTLNDVQADEALPGDGYDRYVKPFRTVEDIYVHAALLGYLRKQAPSLSTDLTRLIDRGAPLAEADRDAKTTHLQLHDWLLATNALFPKLDAVMGEDWQRDKALFEVAQKARDARVAKAQQPAE